MDVPESGDDSNNHDLNAKSENDQIIPSVQTPPTDQHLQDGDKNPLPDPDGSKFNENAETTTKTQAELLIQPEKSNDQKPSSLPIDNKSIVDSHKPTINIGQNNRPPEGKKKDDDKLAIYKALAIKLKKELVKAREELQKLRDDSQKTISDLEKKLNAETSTHESESLQLFNRNATLEAEIKSIQSRSENLENELHAIQTEYENYKIRASEILQRNNPVQSLMQSNKSFDEERYKQLKQLKDDYKIKVTKLSANVEKLKEQNRELQLTVEKLQNSLDQARQEVSVAYALKANNEKLLLDNESLKKSLQQKEELVDRKPKKENNQNSMSEIERNKRSGLRSDIPVVQMEHINLEGGKSDPLLAEQSYEVPSASQVSPATSSVDSYVHIKPAPLEIVSRSSALDDAQNQIDSLTKAYLESESTNHLLSDQVNALKEEIRRIQRLNERMDLAENLEYLKNVVIRFLSLDQNQIEQKQRLIPVLSTVLKLSPEETAKLETTATIQRGSVTSSLFKLS